MTSRNIVASDDGGGEYTPTVTSSGSHWSKKKRSKQEFLHIRVVCVKSNRGAEGSRNQYLHHKNATTKLSQTFGAVNHFVQRNSEGESESKNYTDIQSENVGNLTNMKFLEARVIAYYMMALYIVLNLPGGYYLEVEYLWVILLQQVSTCLSTGLIYPVNMQSFFKGNTMIILSTLRILLVVSGPWSCL